VFTYVRRDFIDGVNMYDAKILYKRFRAAAAGLAVRAGSR
jgi:hypothetical protein